MLEDTDVQKIIKVIKCNKNLLNLEGLHKLIRVSPFGKNNKTHTSLSFINVSLEQKIHFLEIKDSDLKYDFFKSTGPGGQHKNKTLSAVRITHIPTGSVSTSGNERSQQDNKKIALENLKYKIRISEHKKIMEFSQEKRDFSIKNQFFTASYSMISHVVKCEKSGKKSNDLKSFFNGDLELIFDL